MGETLVINNDRLFAPVGLRQISGYAHIDTGARHSSILQAHSARFPPIGTREVHGALRTISVPQICVDEIHFLDESFRDVVVDVQPDSQGDLDTLPFEVTMALGCDMLLQKPLYLDFVEGEIAFLGNNMLNTMENVRLETNFNLGIPILPVSFHNHVLDAVFDTGGGLSLLNQRLLGMLQTGLTEDEPIEVEDATGAKHTIPTFRCKDLVIGECLLEEFQFLVIDLSAIEQAKHLQIDFVFGLNAMKGKRWIVNRQESFIELMRTAS